MRTQQIKNYLASGMFATCPSYMESLVETVNSGEIAKETIADVSPSHSYEALGNVAVISIDGAMTKKNTWMNAMCGGFTSYDILSEYISKAESNPAVDTILFNVDTAGGEVAGADEVGEQIFASSKKTVTFYNNLGASAGIWIFSASNEIYANRTAMIGSIGVMAGYRDADRDDSQVVLVSKNAENKNCSLNGDCKQKIQARIDDVEVIFYERVIRNTGLTKEAIAKSFQFGDVISATNAKEVGFIKEIVTFDVLLKSLQILEANPTVSDDNSKKFNIGADMKFDRENLDDTEANFNALVQNRTTMQGRNESLTVKLENAESALEASKGEIDTLVASHEAQLSEAEGNFKAEVVTRVEEAVTIGANIDTIVAMVNAGSAEEASKIAIDAKESKGASAKVDEDADVDAKNLAARTNIAKSFAKSISV